MRIEMNRLIDACMFDQDKNGTNETYIEYSNGNVLREGVDLDGLEGYEIIFLYEQGILKEAYRYYRQVDKESGNRTIGNTRFEFGYPLAESIVFTKLTPIEFSKKYWSKTRKTN